MIQNSEPELLINVRTMPAAKGSWLQSTNVRLIRLAEKRKVNNCQKKLNSNNHWASSE